MKKLALLALLLALSAVYLTPTHAAVQTSNYQISGVVSAVRPSIFNIIYGVGNVNAANVIINPVSLSSTKDYNETHNSQVGTVYFYTPDQFTMTVNITFYVPTTETIQWVFSGGTQNLNYVSDTYQIVNETSVSIQFTLQLAQEVIAVSADQMVKIQADATALGITQGFAEAAKLQAVNNDAVTVLAVGFFFVLIEVNVFIVWFVIRERRKDEYK